MNLAPGTRIGPYEIVSMVGAGGMGEVYRAHDDRLGRDVALKILPAIFASDPDRIARFDREARTLATLNHPHIGAIYGVEETTEVRALALEFVEGETLADRLSLGPIPLDEALSIARQVAEALEAAHELGIIHRDLKPANIKVRNDGLVKVLDFGLAKALQPASGVSADASASPTITNAAMTRMGIVLGTAAYMAPEQARGKPVDKRADLWAFGCVLFEMLTRRRPFEGGARSDVAQILQMEPDWSCLPAETPEALRTLIQRCLRTDPDRRVHDIADARIELEDLVNVSHTQAGKAAERHVMRIVPWLIAAVSAAALVATLLRLPETQPHDHPVASLEVILPSGVEPYIGPSAVAISGDGARVAFVGIEAGTRQVYLREIAKFSIVPLRGTTGATAVFFSPDSRSVAFIMTDRTLKKVTLDDGLVVPLASQVDFTTGGSWGADDRITFSRDGVLWDIAASGGAATQLTTLDRTKGELLHTFPTSVSQRNAVLFAAVTGANRDAAHVESVRRESGVSRRHRVVEWATSPTYVGNGQLLFFRAGALFSVPFDEHALQVTGSGRRVIEEVGVTPEGAPMVGVSRGGSVIYVSETTSTQLVWVARDGQEAPLTTTARHYLTPRVSPDGKRIAVAAGGDIWIQDAASPTFAKLTNEATTGNTYPIWLSDRRLVFRTNMGLHSVNADGSGALQSIPETSTADFPNAVSLGGERLAFLRTTPDNKADLYALSLVGPPRPRPIVRSRAHEGGAQFSPDGKWLAYSSDESGHFQVFVSPYPALDRKWPVSPAGKYVVWNRNGMELFYRDGTRLMTVDVATRGSEPMFSSPRQLFDHQYDYGPGLTVANYDVSADGQRFLMVKRHGTATRMNVVLNALTAMR